MSFALRAIPVVTAVAILTASTVALVGGGTYWEVEPNDDKSSANHVPLFEGGYDRIQGTGYAGGSSDRDRFLLQPAPGSAVRPYQYRVDLDWISTLNTGYLRGLEQALGAVDPDSDAIVQASIHRHTGELRWYGFGKGEQVHFDAGNLDFFRWVYEAAFTRTEVTPTAIATAFDPGEITISTAGQGHATDSDLWVYDARFNALPGYGNDDDPTSTTQLSTLRRTYAPGRYHLAITSGNLAGDQASPADDRSRSEPVLEHPDIVASSSMVPAESWSGDLSFSIEDGAQHVDVPAVQTESYQVLWFSFDVGEGQAIVPFCEGSGTASCPCGNDGLPQRGDGCANSTGRGALLYASGTTSVAADDLAFHAHGFPPGASAILFAGNAIQPPAVFGDGLLCIAGSKVRLGLRSSDARGMATWTGAVGTAGWTAAGPRYAQVWYRDPNGPCGSQFNTTNGLEVQLVP